jgi:predicted secreted protein
LSAANPTKQFLQLPFSQAVCALFLPLILWNATLGASHGLGNEMVTVTSKDNGKEVQLSAGGIVQVELEQAGAAGYIWEIEGLDPQHFEVVKTATISQPPKGEIMGAPVLVGWSILAKKSGTSELRFIHYRPWEGKQSAIATFSVRVLIQ